MTTLLQEAFAAAEKLPPDEQDVLASRLLAEVADEGDCDRTIGSQVGGHGERGPGRTSRWFDSRSR